MESRYALRSLECAIGYDSRRLHDGRRAIFRHTPIHMRFRMDFMERRDMILLMQTSSICMAMLGANPAIDASRAADSAEAIRTSLFSQTLPYMRTERRNVSQEDAIEEGFDELDRILEMQDKEASGIGVEARK